MRLCSDASSKQFILDRVEVENGGCWIWTKSINPKTGYGQIGYAPYTAHRLAFKLWNGRYPAGLTRHRCNNKACCNPAHLTEGTDLQNYHDSKDAHDAADAKRRGRVPRNAIAVEINGTAYPSKDAARRSLGVAWRTIDRMITHQR